MDTKKRLHIIRNYDTAPFFLNYSKYEHVILKNQRQGASCYERITKKIHFFCNIVQRFAF